MKKNMNASTDNSGKPIVDNNSSAQSQSNISSRSSNTKSSNSINNSLNVILPQYTVIDQQNQNLFDQNGKRTVQSSPSKSHRKFSQDSSMSASKYKNVSDDLKNV